MPCVALPVMSETASNNGLATLRAITLMPLYSVTPSLRCNMPLIVPVLAR